MHGFQFTRSTLGRKLLKWGQLFLEEILWRGGKFSGSSFPRDNYPRGKLSDAQLSMGQSSTGQLPWNPKTPVWWSLFNNGLKAFNSITEFCEILWKAFLHKTF